MLAVSPLRATTTKDGRDQADMEFLSSTTTVSPSSFTIAADVDFPDFDSIDFDDLFDGDPLAYLDMDSELLADFSVCPSSGGEEEAAMSVDTANQVVPNCYSSSGDNHNKTKKKKMSSRCGGESKEDGGDCCKISAMETSKEEEIESKKSSPPVKESEKGKKLSATQAKNTNNNNEGKRKTKVDWTPELHRRFVQAVEQLGVDKAVPSRILELMGIDCLTRHNVASHLQKYRSHRKHLLAREAEAASWTQKRQMYGIAVVPPNSGTTKGNPNHPWHAPTIGFPPPRPPPIHHPHHPFRPLHVWGHPTHHVEHQTPMPIWPKHLVHPPSPLPPQHHTWLAPLQAHPPAPPTDPSLWHSRHQHVPNAVTPVTPWFPQPLSTTRFEVQPVPGIAPPHAAMYKPDQHGTGAPAMTLQSGLIQADPFDLHPTKESIDAAIGDVLSKPWLPLPIGLKPPSTDSVMGELQRQGIPAIPPSCA